MIRFTQKIFLVLISCALLLVGRLLLGAPALPDDFFGWQKRIGLLLIHLFFDFQLFLWGWLLLSKTFSKCGLPQSLPSSESFAFTLFSLSMGAAFLALLGVGLGCGGLIGEKYSFVYLLILFVPFFFPIQSPFHARVEKEEDESSPFFKKALVVAFCVGLVAYVVDGFSLKSHGDVFNYHLPATRLWFDLGRIAVVDALPSAHQAGLWDTFHLWGVELLSGPEGRGLVAVQYFAQWSQVIIAYGGSFSLLYLLFKSFGLSPSLSLIAAFAGISVHEINPAYAKNDWGSTFWIIAGVALIEWGKSNLKAIQFRALLLGGICLGCGITSKWTTLLFVVPWFFSQYFFISFRFLLALGASIFAGALPILLRNEIQVGNPVFPILNHIFKSPYVIPSLQKDFNLYHSEHFAVTIEKVQALFVQMLRDLPYDGLLIIGIFIFFFVGKKTPKRLWALYFSTLVGLFLFIGQTSFRIPARLAGPLLVFISSSSMIIFILFFDSILFRKLLRSTVFQFILFVILCACSHFPLYAFKKAFAYKPSQETVELLMGGTYKKWIRQNIPLGSSIVHCDNEFYYLLGYKLRMYPDLIELKESQTGQVNQSDNPEWLFTELTPAGTDYLALGLFDPHLVKVINLVRAKWPASIRYDAGGVVIVQVNKTF